MKSFKSFLKEDGPPITKLMTKSGVAYHVHSDHAHKFKSMVDDLETSGYKIKSISSYRPGATVAGSGHRSAHADAMAIDINPGQNPHTFPHHHNYGQTDMPDIVRKDRLHKKYGLGWGGEWKNSKDTMHFSAHPREGADPNWKPAQKPEASAASPEEKPEKVSSAPMAPKYMSLTPEKPKTPEPKPEKPIAYDDGGATNAAATKKPEPVATPEPTPELPKTQPKSEPQSTSGKSWSDVRAAAGYSARQSVTSDPALLDLYNKYKEGKMNENFEQFIKKKYR